MIENIISDAADIQKFIMAEPRDKTPRIEAVDMAFVLLKYIILGGISLASLWIISGTVILIATGRFLSIPAPVDINIIIPLVSSATTLILGYLFGKKE
jgi:hypothetical protein